MINVKKSTAFYFVSFLCFVSVPVVRVLGFEENPRGENQHVIDDGNPVADPAPSTKLVVTSADWCGPCKKLKPTIASLKKEGYKVTEKTDNSPTHPVPRLQWFRFGELEQTEYGALPKEEIVKIFTAIENKVF